MNTYSYGLDAQVLMGDPDEMDAYMDVKGCQSDIQDA